jgi:thiol-disulfide isomerase/thioredoxin
MALFENRRQWLFSSFVSFASVVAITSPLFGADNTLSLKGKPAPAVELKTPTGETVSLAALKGNVVLLDFWATWCPPCRKGLPHINDIAANAEYKKAGLSVWAINVREEAKVVEKYMADEKLTAMTVVLDSEAAADKAFKNDGFPTTIVIGRDGNVAAVFLGLPKDMKEINQAVEAALKEKAPEKTAEAGGAAKSEGAAKSSKTDKSE